MKQSIRQPVCGVILLPLLFLLSGQTGQITLTVDARTVTGQISPYIYGSNEDDWANSGKHLTFGRQGGNRMTAYNWENNASNAGNDWHNQSDDYLGGGNTPGEVPRKAVADALAHGSAFLVTIPMAGYVAADKSPGGDVNQTPDYLEKRFDKSVPKKSGPFAYPPDLTDKVVYQDEFVYWLEKQFPTRPAGSAIWYSLDNEPDLWSNTHARIHPKPTSYAEIIERSVAYASAIKDVAPKTLVFGPASYGWNGFVNFQDAQDKQGRDFLNFYLDSMHGAQAASGRRLLDVLDIHWYPEAKGGGKRILEADNSEPIATARMQATRSLWDPSYVEDSWITQASTGGKAIDLIPRMKQKIKDHYPGTKLAITEYDCGGANHISGAIAEADALGIFGREGVFAAAYWPASGDKPFLHAAFDAYRNYDGAGAAFGDWEVLASSSEPATVSIYASKTAGPKPKVVCVIVNQATSSRPASLQLSVPSMRAVRQFSLTGAQPKLVPSNFAERANGGMVLTLPALSVNVLELQ